MPTNMLFILRFRIKKYFNDEPRRGLLVSLKILNTFFSAIKNTELNKLELNSVRKDLSW